MRRGLARLIGQTLPALALDAALLLFSYVVALVIRFEGAVPGSYFQGLWSFAPLILPAYLAPSYFFGLYRRIWRYATGNEVVFIWAAAALGTAVVGAANFTTGNPRLIPTSVVLFGGFFALGTWTAVRYRQRLVTGFLWRWQAAFQGASRVLIVGAGEAGQLLAFQLRSRPQSYTMVGFIDDDPQKLGMQVHGVRVLGGRATIKAVAARTRADVIVIAIHRIAGQDFRDILEECQETTAQIKVLPDVLEMMDERRGEPLLRDVALEDLLGRKAVPMNEEVCRSLVAGKVVLVTGAGGSIGSELAGRIAGFQPQRLLLLDSNESAIYDLTLRLMPRLPEGAVRPLVTDILREGRIRALFASHRPQIVFHCAAYKHVPLMEEHPEEAVLVNVLGTRSLAGLAQEFGVERFVFISSDKAVAPQSIMGMTKRLGELLMVSLGKGQEGCRFTAVRFGNVLNSRGSVVPTFQWQLETGQPITVTDPRMKRFFMSSQEAVNLILQAAALTQGGDIFLLDMGEELHVVDLAHRLIRLRGLRAGEDVEIRYTGMRPGEKLEEELFTPAFEERQPTENPYISRIRSSLKVDREALLQEVDELVDLAWRGRAEELAARLRSRTAPTISVS